MVAINVTLDRSRTVLLKYSRPTPFTYDVTIQAVDMGTALPHPLIVGVSVYVDGSYVGTTPVTVKLSAGAHTVRLTKSGYDPSENTYNITGPLIINQGIYPAAPPGTVRLSFCVYDSSTGRPVSGASVLIDGNLIGATNTVGAIGIENVTTGSRVFSVIHPLYIPWSATINIPPLDTSLSQEVREDRGTYYWITGTQYHTINVRFIKNPI